MALDPYDEVVTKVLLARWETMNSLLMDVRYAVRMLCKSPAFTAVVALSLGLGIGVNSTIFSFVNAVLFRPPAVEKPGQLVEVWHHVRSRSGFNSYPPLSFPDFDYYRSHIMFFPEWLVLNLSSVLSVGTMASRVRT